jgi:hypothetical protein
LIKQKLKEIGDRILRFNGRVGDKMLALEYCLRSTIAYRMQFCVWGIVTYDELDSIYTKIVRKITRNMHGYPSKPIWALAVDGGLGIHSLLDYVHKCKLRLLLRNIDKNDSTGKAFEGLVSRALRSAGTGGLRWRGQSIRSSLGAPVWLSSLVAWLSRMGIEIRVQGPPSVNPASELIDGSIEERLKLANRGIALIGENSEDQALTSLQLRVGQVQALQASRQASKQVDGQARIAANAADTTADSDGAAALGATIAAVPASIVIICFSGIFSWFTIGLFGFHSFLVYKGMSTNEYIKGYLDKFNQYSKGACGNYLALCRLPKSAGKPPILPPLREAAATSIARAGLAAEDIHLSN